MSPPPRPRESGVTTPAVVALLALAVGSALVVGAVAQSQSPPTGDEILDRVERSYERAETVTGTAVVRVSNGSATTSAEVEFASADPNRTRLVVHREGVTVVAGVNGTAAWAYDPATDRLRVWESPESMNSTASIEGAELPDRFDADRPAWSEENVTATRLRTETANGTELAVVRLEPANESLPVESTLWVDTERWTVTKQRTTVGDNETVVAVREVRFNVSVHESTFDPPTGDTSELAGVSRERYDAFAAAESNTELSLPALDDAGYAFEEAVVTTARGETTVAQRYRSDTGEALLLTTTADRLPVERANATTVELDGRTATVSTVRGRTVVSWRADGVVHAVAADGSRSDVVALAEAVQS